LDYYEYKKMHEQRMRQAAAAGYVPAPAKPEAEKPVAPAAGRRSGAAQEAERKPARAPEAELSKPLDLQDADELDLPEEPLDLPEENKSLFSGVKALMKGVANRVPADEPEEQPSKDSGFMDDEELDEDDVEPDDAPQIDNPIGDALIKVKGLFQSARQKLAERRAAKPEAEEVDEFEDEAPAQPARAQDGAEETPALSRRMRKASEVGKKAEEPPILDIGAVDASEVDDLVSKPGTTVHTGFEEDEAPKAARPLVEIEPDDEDDDDLPSARGTRVFGFFKKFRGKSAQGEWDARPETDEPDGEGQEMDEQQKAVLTQRLSEELDGAPALSRKERKALAAGKAVRPQAPAAPVIPAAPVTPASNTVFAAVPDAPAAMPFAAPTSARTAYAVDEPTQQFRPLRARPARVAPPEPARPLEFDDEYYEDEDDDLPVRKAAKPPKPPKTPKEKKRKLYQDEDLEDEEYEEENRYDEEYDDYDDYDDYDEDDERYEDEYHVSGGRRFLGFLKGLLVLILFLALCVLALRQLEASRLISLGGLRDAAGQIIPINLILPSPEPTATPMPTEAPTPEPTVAPTPESTAAPEATIPAETPGAQVEPTEFTSVD
jgi:hypothetical protein